MFNRILLFIVCITSICWITYVGYDLINRRDNLSPRSIFGAEDDELVIFNRTAEVDLAQINVEIKHVGLKFLEELLEHPVQNERIYISKKRNVLLVEKPNLWSRTSVTEYFASKNLTVTFAKKKEFKLSNGYIGRYQQNFLVLSDHYVERVKNRLDWPTWDKKATVTIISLDQPMLSTDIYFKSDGIVSYQTKMTSEFKSRKINDQELFAENLPAKLTNYHFYEKNFAVFSEVISNKSALYQWMDNGMVLFEYNGVNCIVSDYQNNQEPLLVLNELQTNSNTQWDEKELIRGIQLTNNFPSKKSNGFYLMKLGDKVVISESLEVCQQIVADFQLGKTIALHKDISDLMYLKLPHRVSERAVAATFAYTQSAYKDILVKTVHNYFKAIEVVEDVKQADKESNWTTAIDGKTVSMTGKNGSVFTLNAANQLVITTKGKKQGAIDLQGNLMGTIKFIDYNGDGQLYMMANTSAAIYVSDLRGNLVAGFPIQLANATTNEVTYYRYQNKGQFIYCENAQKAIVLNEKGTLIKGFAIAAGNVSKSIDVFLQKGNLIAVVPGDKSTQTVNLTKFKTVKNHPALPAEYVVVKEADGPKYYAFTNGSLMRYDYTGKSVVLGNYPNAHKLKIVDGTLNYITFESYGKIHILNMQGIKLSQVDVPFKELVAYDVQTMKNGKTYVAMVEGIENNLYLFDTKGTSLLKKNYEAKDNVYLSEVGNSLLVTTVGNGFLVQYFDILME